MPPTQHKLRATFNFSSILIYIVFLQAMLTSHISLSLNVTAIVTGHYDIQKLDKIMWQLYHDYGKVVRLGGLLGHPDLLFVFDASLVEQVFRREEHMPHRPSMPSLHHYKNVLRKDFFGDTPGVIGV